MPAPDDHTGTRQRDLTRLAELAVPYGAPHIQAAAGQTTDMLTSRHTIDTTTHGTAAADSILAATVLNNLRHAVAAIADAHAGCRRKNCRACDNIRVALVELIAYRTVT